MIDSSFCCILSAFARGLCDDLPIGVRIWNFHDGTTIKASSWADTDVITYGGYCINNNFFYSKMEDGNSTIQNNWVTLQVEAVHFVNFKDKNPVTTSMSYFGIIQEIWEVEYVSFRVLVFKCK